MLTQFNNGAYGEHPMARLNIVWVLILASACAEEGPVPRSDRSFRMAQTVETSDEPLVNTRVFGVVTELSHIHLDGVLRRYVTENGGDYEAFAEDREAREL